MTQAHINCLIISVSRGGTSCFDTKSVAYSQMSIQLNILDSVKTVIDSSLSDVMGILEAKLFDNELDSARHLLKSGYLRASGALCGVILETHFSNVVKNHNLKMTKKLQVLMIIMNCLKKKVFMIQLIGDLFSI